MLAVICCLKIHHSTNNLIVSWEIGQDFATLKFSCSNRSKQLRADKILFQELSAYAEDSKSGLPYVFTMQADNLGSLKSVLYLGRWKFLPSKIMDSVNNGLGGKLVILIHTCVGDDIKPGPIGWRLSFSC